MSDLILLSLAGFFTGLSQLINKMLTKYGFSSKTYTVVVMLFNALLAIPLLFYRFHIPSSIYYWVLVIISTVSFAFSVLFSFKAYKTTDVSIVSIIYRLNIVLIALAGTLFLGESYSLGAYLGLALIFASSTLFAFEGRRLKFSKGVVYAFLMAFTGAVASVLDKVILQDFSPYSYAFFNNFLIGLVFAFNLKTIKEGSKLLSQNKLLLFLTAFFSLMSFVIVLVVLERTDVSRTLPVYKAFSLIAPVLLGVLLLGERKKLLQKVIGTILGLAGILLLY